MIQLIPKQLGTPLQFANQLLGVWIDQQFAWVKAMTRIRLIRTMDAIAIDSAGPCCRYVTVPHLVSELW